MMCRSHSASIAGKELLFVAIVIFGGISTTFAQSAPSADKVAKANLTYKVIDAEGGGYGYDIFIDGKLFIHQPGIPGQPGITGFRKKSDSEKVAALVIKKLKSKEMPPAITKEELQQLKVID